MSCQQRLLPRRHGDGGCRVSSLSIEHEPQVHSTDVLEGANKEIKRRSNVRGLSLAGLGGPPHRRVAAGAGREWSIAAPHYFGLGAHEAVVGAGVTALPAGDPGVDCIDARPHKRRSTNFPPPTRYPPAMAPSTSVTAGVRGFAGSAQRSMPRKTQNLALEDRLSVDTGSTSVTIRVSVIPSNLSAQAVGEC